MIAQTLPSWAFDLLHPRRLRVSLGVRLLDEFASDSVANDFDCKNSFSHDLLNL